jgi:16S rRNA (guanine966-N2)-methyltransferase
MVASRIGSFEGLRVADLYAGSGALGLEAISRGAEHATFVEADRQVTAVITENASKLGVIDHVQILATSALRLPPSEPFHLIFADPPYRSGAGSAAVAAVVEADWLARGGLMCVESARGESVDPHGLFIDAARQVGPARLTLLRRP